LVTLIIFDRVKSKFGHADHFRPGKNQNSVTLIIFDRVKSKFGHADHFDRVKIKIGSR